MYKIYKIVDNTNGNVYIGQTINRLSDRLAQHKSRPTCSCGEIIKNGDYKIELIEETDDKMRERYWIENTECVNKNIPGRTDKEYKQYYREKNKDKIKAYQKEYRDRNKKQV
jgi:hypothetical protein